MPNSTPRALSLILRHARGRILAQALLAAPAVGLVPGLVGCSEATVDDGSIRGTASVLVATMDDGTSRMEYRLLVGGDENDERRLVFETASDLATGDNIKVWGDVLGSEIVVKRWQLVEAESSSGLGTSQEAIIDGTPYAARTFAYVLVDIGGGIGTYTQAAANTDVFGTGPNDGSTKQWFLEASYGRQDVTGSVVTGLRYVMTGCDTSQLASTLKPQVNAALGGTAPQHYLWYFLTQNTQCGWSGLGSVANPTRPASDTWYNHSQSCVVLVQEPSHNFGMQHSSSLRCAAGVTFPNDPSTTDPNPNNTCTPTATRCCHREYGDSFDPMGGGCRHTNAWQKAYLGWFGGCNSVRVNQSGTFTLHPLEAECNGIQVLQIPMPVTGRTIPRSGGGGEMTIDPVLYYFVELRTSTGFDQGITTGASMVLVHVGPDYRSRTQTGLHTWILDMNPATAGNTSFDGMAVGQTFTDPAGGVSFRLDAADATTATVTVTVPTNTANTCAGGGTLVAPGPATCGASTGGTGGAGGGAGTGGRGGAGAGGTGGRGGAGAGGTGGRGGAGAGGTGGRGGAGAGGTGGRGGAGAGGAGAGGAGAGGAGAGGAGAGGAGAGGASGDGGVAGMSGDGGIGGMSGFGGDSSAGAAGFAGGGFGGDSSAGAAGFAGVAGFPTAGAGGAGVAGAGQAGSAITAGAAGAAVAGAGPGSAGAGPGPGGGRGKPAIVGDEPGCGCRIDQAPPRRDAALFVGLVGLVAGGLMRRRRTRPESSS